MICTSNSEYNSLWLTDRIEVGRGSIIGKDSLVSMNESPSEIYNLTTYTLWSKDTEPARWEFLKGQGEGTHMLALIEKFSSVVE